MFQLSSVRADARSLACALTAGLLSAVAFGAFGEAHAQVASPLQPVTAPAHGGVSEAVLRSAVARTDLSPMGMLNRPIPAPVSAQAVPAQPVSTRSTAAPSVNGRELDCMAQAVYFEARGESALGQAAVAQVVLNRVRHPAFPKSVCGVVFQRAGHSCQFSWACHRPHGPGNAGQWAQARAVAARVMAGEVVAGIGFATHFNGARARGFGGGLQRVAQIGAHAFYRFNGAKGAASMFSAPIRVAQAQPASRVYASLLPIPSRAETSKLISSASTAVQAASSAVQKVVVDAAQSAAQNLTSQHPAPGAAALAVAAVAPAAVQYQAAPQGERVRSEDMKTANAS